MISHSTNSFIFFIFL